MECPFCSATMKTGRVYFCERSLLGGHKYAREVGDFVFWPGARREDEAVPKLRNDAFWCSDCDTVLMPGAFADPDPE